MGVRQMWQGQIERIFPKDMDFIYPFAIFMEIIDSSQHGDVISLVEDLTDACTARKMTVAHAFFKTRTALAEVNEESLALREREILASLRMHAPTEQVVLNYVRTGYQTSMHLALAGLKTILKQIEQEPALREALFQSGAFDAHLRCLIYYRSMFDPESTGCPRGIADMVKKYMDAKLAYERGKRLT